MAEITTPDWLAKRRGELRPSNAGIGWIVLLNGEPQYRLVPVPAAGKHSCEVVQTVNGKRLDKGGIYPTVEDALRGGLEELRMVLGW
jgi:hypothetical protein